MAGNGMSDVEWAYIAGFIDGEGSIGMHQHNSGTGVIHAVTLSVTNRSEEVLRFVQQRLKGEVIKVRSTNPNSNYVFNYKLMGRDRLTYALTGTLPYAIVKRAQIELALEFFDKCPAQRGIPLTEDDWRFRESFRLRFGELNRRGLYA